jgi:PAS domain S-box-containing protein
MTSEKYRWLIYSLAFVVGGLFLGSVASLNQIMTLGVEYLDYRALITPVIVGGCICFGITFAIFRNRQHNAEQLESQRKLNEAQSRYQEIIEGTADLIGVVDGNGNIVFVNHKAFDIFGISPEECVGRSVFNFVHPQDQQATMTEFQDWLEKKEPSVLFENRQVHKDGSFRHMQWRIQYHKTGQQNETMFLSIARDITEQKNLEDQLRQSQKMQAIGQLTGGVAHDFNNLLAVMVGNAEMLDDSVAGDAQATQVLASIKKATERAAALTDRLLTFSRQQSLAPVAVNFVDLINGLEDMLSRTMGPNFDLQFENQEDLWPGMVDPHQFENVLVNLAVNARHAMKLSGNLSFHTSNVTLSESPEEQFADVEAGDYVLIAVRDDGCGMSEQLKSRVFEPFFTTRNVGEGSGLGLSMAFGFAKQSGGHAAIESEEGKGTTVFLYLPRLVQTTDQASTEN